MGSACDHRKSANVSGKQYHTRHLGPFHLVWGQVKSRSQFAFVSNRSWVARVIPPFENLVGWPFHPLSKSSLYRGVFDPSMTTRYRRSKSSSRSTGFPTILPIT